MLYVFCWSHCRRKRGETGLPFPRARGLSARLCIVFETLSNAVPSVKLIGSVCVTCVAYPRNGIRAFPHSLRASAHVPRYSLQSQTVRHTGDEKYNYKAQHEKGNADPQKGSHINVIVHHTLIVQSILHPRPVPNPDLRLSRITSAVLPANTTLPLP